MRKTRQSWSASHGRAGAAREKHPDQSTSGVLARRREDASKSAAPQNRRMVRSDASSRVQLRALRSEPHQRTFRRAPIGHNRQSQSGENGNKIMFILMNSFRFLDIMNYLGPGTSYEKWVKAYECETVKSWFPYEWLDTPEKLDFPRLPKYEEWYSKLKGEYVLTRDEWEGCQRVFAEKDMQMFADWLRYYNNLDVAPGLEALERMRAFDTEKGIDILKDAVSIPGVSLHYLLRGAVERGAELYSPGKQAYEMLKEAVVGGPSLVFTRYHEVGVTKIRSHQTAEPHLRKRILGYDANAMLIVAFLEPFLVRTALEAK